MKLTSLAARFQARLNWHKREVAKPDRQDAAGPWDPSPHKRVRANVQRAVDSLQAKPRRRVVEGQPWRGLDDSRCEGYVVVEYGRTVKIVER